LFDEGEQQHPARRVLHLTGKLGARARLPTAVENRRRECLVNVMIVVQCQSHLLEIVAALGAACCLASGLNGRQQQGDQDADDGDDHQELDECETSTESQTTPRLLSRVTDHERHLPQMGDSKEKNENDQAHPTPTSLCRCLDSQAISAGRPQTAEPQINAPLL